MSDSITDELAPYTAAVKALLVTHGYPTDEAALHRYFVEISRAQIKALEGGAPVPEGPPKFVQDCEEILARVRLIQEAAERGRESDVRFNLRCLGAVGARLSVFPLLQAEAGRDAGRHAGGLARKGKTKIASPSEACREYLQYRMSHPTISPRQALEKIAKRHGISRSTLDSYLKKSANT